MDDGLERALVTVAIPAFNHERYIVDCLDSVKSTDHRPLEVLVLDDGSSDPTLALARDWAQRHAGPDFAVTVSTQDNQGVTRTLNSLVRAAQGDFIALLASDDLLAAEGISTRIRALEDRPECLAVFGDCRVVDETGSVLFASGLRSLHAANIDALQVPTLMARELILRWSVPGPVFLARAATFDPAIGVGLYDETVRVEDRDFYLRLMARKALCFVADSVADYRVHGANSALTLAREREIAESEARHVQDFHGVERVLLELTARKKAATVSKRETRSVGSVTRWLIWTGVARFAYVVHTARVGWARKPGST